MYRLGHALLLEGMSLLDPQSLLWRSRLFMCCSDPVATGISLLLQLA